MEYPARFSVNTPEKVANWRVLVHWLLIIPHAVVVYILSIAFLPLWILSWIITLFTGSNPEFLAKYFTMLIRYEHRVSAFLLVLSDQYPPFEFNGDGADPGGHQARTDIDVQLDGHNRLTVLFRPILLIPVIVVLTVLEIIALVLGVVMFFVLLFTGRWPAGIRNFFMAFIGLNVRTGAYMTFLTDRYPLSASQ